MTAIIPVASQEETNSDDFVASLYGEKELRHYQISGINRTILCVANGAKRVLLVLPTGAGKTLLIAAAMSCPAMRKALGLGADRPLRVLFVALNHRLLSQAERTFAEESNVELILQSAFSDIPESVMATGWDITIIDEGHHEACGTIQYKLEQLGEQVIIGLTATPDRPDGSIIKFDHIIEPISREQAVKEGWLAPTNLHSIVDVPSKDKLAVLQDVFESYIHQMGQTLIFVKSKKEVKALSQIIHNLGYSVIGLLDQSKAELDDVLNRFSNGEIQFIINCNRLSEGVDVQNCTDVVIGRQLGSYVALNQIIGRAARPDGGINGQAVCNVWELINPLSATNLDACVVVGIPEMHRLLSKEQNKWVEREFDYVTHKTSKQLGIAEGVRIRHG